MRIDALEVYYVALPLIRPWRSANGVRVEIHSLLVRMLSDGSEAWSEATPFYAPTYSPETATSAFFLLTEFFAPRLVGKEIDSAQELLNYLKPFKGNPIAKAGLESAWWMLTAKRTAQPLHRLLGGTTRPVEAGADFGIQDSYDDLLQSIQRAVDRGFRRVKLKVRPGWDLEMVKVVRSTFPDLTMHIDCNACYAIEDLPLFKELDGLELAMIEQPLFHRDLVDHAKLQSALETPICLDESVTSVRDFETALRLGSCRMLNIKYPRVGGLSVAVELHDMAEEAGIPCWVGGLFESAIGTGIGIELATLPNFTYPADLYESRQFYRHSLTEPETRINPDCTFSPSTVPGTPYEPDVSEVKRVTRKRTRIEG